MRFPTCEQYFALRIPISSSDVNRPYKLEHFPEELKSSLHIYNGSSDRFHTNSYCIY